jgi:hypothetical protein
MKEFEELQEFKEAKGRPWQLPSIEQPFCLYSGTAAHVDSLNSLNSYS